MSEQLTKTIFDAATGEATILPLTEEEIAEYNARIAASEQAELARQEEESAKAASLESAKQKLATLGLSEDEILALLNN